MNKNGNSLKILTEKGEITQDAMKSYLELKKQEELIKKQKEELENHLLDALQKNHKPTRGLFTCKINWTTPKLNIPYKDELLKRITKAEFTLIQETSPKTESKPKVIVEVSAENSLEFTNTTKET